MPLKLLLVSLSNLKEEKKGGKKTKTKKKPAAEDLHAEEGHDEDGEHEQHQQGRDRGDRVDQRLHQVTHAPPVPNYGGVKHKEQGYF